MIFKIKNMTYSPLRVMVGNTEINFFARKYTFINEINEDLLKLEKKGFIRIRKVK
tara:strand:- start:876 stop:1040 length:165 start_codon:yes stop_codon:yes gene_type:complete